MFKLPYELLLGIRYTRAKRRNGLFRLYPCRR